MNHKKVEEYILSFEGAWLDYPFGGYTAVYKVDTGGANPDADGRRANPDADGRGKMFAIIQENSDPLRLSLKCDPQLAETLREKYESVMPGYHLNKKHWNTILLTGQITWEEIQDLIRHSYNLVANRDQAKY